MLTRRLRARLYAARLRRMRLVLARLGSGEQRLHVPTVAIFGQRWRRVGAFARRAHEALRQAEPAARFTAFDGRRRVLVGRLRNLAPTGRRQVTRRRHAEVRNRLLLGRRFESGLRRLLLDLLDAVEGDADAGREIGDGAGLLVENLT